MFDGSHLPVEEKNYKKLLEKAHAKGISVEAEVGTIGGEDEGRTKTKSKTRCALVVTVGEGSG